MKLETGQDYIAQARFILNDTVTDNVSGYRYTDNTLLVALTLALFEATRLRPDLFLSFTPPAEVLVATDLTPLDIRYRRAVLDYVTGYAEMQDLEAADAGRALAYQASFAAKLVGASA